MRDNISIFHLNNFLYKISVFNVVYLFFIVLKYFYLDLHTNSSKVILLVPTKLFLVLINQEQRSKYPLSIFTPSFPTTTLYPFPFFIFFIIFSFSFLIHSFPLFLSPLSSLTLLKIYFFSTFVKIIES